MALPVSSCVTWAALSFTHFVCKWRGSRPGVKKLWGLTEFVSKEPGRCWPVGGPHEWWLLSSPQSLLGLQDTAAELPVGHHWGWTPEAAPFLRHPAPGWRLLNMAWIEGCLLKENSGCFRSPFTGPIPQPSPWPAHSENALVPVIVEAWVLQLWLTPGLGPQCQQPALPFTFGLLTVCSF